VRIHHARGVERFLLVEQAAALRKPDTTQ
jgi:hypothetical protein